jgi:RNA polymerase sigma factor (sigma-70 family)
MRNISLTSDDSLKEDLSLISSVKQGDNEAIKLLINKHSGICVDTYKKYINLPTICGFISDEIASSKDYIIYNSAKTYDPTMGSKFSTWLSNQTRYFCLNCINKYNKLIPTEDAELINLIESKNKENEPSPSEMEIKIEALNLIKEIIPKLCNQKIKECITRKYFSNDGEHRSYTDVAKEMNVTVQTVINWHKKFIKFAKQKCINRKIIFDFQ